MNDTHMLALRKIQSEPGGIVVDEVRVPQQPKGRQVLVEVEAAGICGTDLHIYNWGDFARGRMVVPRTLGHEIGGVVRSVGSEVSTVKVGQRVAVESHLPCGKCSVCVKGMAHVCPNTTYPGIDFDGGFAEAVLLPEQLLWAVPETVESEVAALMEPFGIAVHAITVGRGVAGENILIQGCGSIGLMAIQASRALGANRIMVTDIEDDRLEMARELGADIACNVSRKNWSSALEIIPEGQRPNIVVDFVGTETSIAFCGEAVANGGEIRLLGVPETSISVDLGKWLFKGVTVRNLHGRRLFDTWQYASRLILDRGIDLLKIVTDRVRLVDGVSAFQRLKERSAVKIILQP